ncbi:MAG: ATP-binding cassette domain-containing protein [Elusimicrobiales bacterium]
MIELRDVSFSYKRVLSSFKKEVFKNFTALFDDGKIHMVLGRNGSGKTTLLKIAAGFLIPSAGYVSIDGAKADYINFPYDKVSIFTDPNRMFYHQLSVVENLRFYSHCDISEIKRFADIVNMDQKNLNLKFAELSCGNRVKAALIKCFMEKRKNILLDEPFAYLDKASQDSILKFILSIKNERCIVIASCNRFFDVYDSELKIDD